MALPADYRSREKDQEHDWQDRIPDGQKYEQILQALTILKHGVQPAERRQPVYQ